MVATKARGKTLPTDAAASRLAEVGGLIDATKTEIDALYRERAALVVQLKDTGMTRDELAALAGTSVEMIKQVLGQARRSAPTAG